MRHVSDAIHKCLILMGIFVERKRPTEALLWVVIMISAVIRNKKLKDQPYNVELLPSFSIDES